VAVVQVAAGAEVIPMTSKQFLCLEILCVILAACCILRGHFGWALAMLGCAAVSNSMIGDDR